MRALHHIARHSTLIITLLFLSLALNNGAQAAAQKPPTFELTLQNHKFTPANFSVPANTPFVIKLHNMDKSVAEFESDDMHAEKIVMGNKTIFIRVRALKSGTYKFFDDFNPKAANGIITAQ